MYGGLLNLLILIFLTLVPRLNGLASLSIETLSDSEFLKVIEDDWFMGEEINRPYDVEIDLLLFHAHVSIKKGTQVTYKKLKLTFLIPKKNGFGAFFIRDLSGHELLKIPNVKNLVLKLDQNHAKLTYIHRGRKVMREFELGRRLLRIYPLYSQTKGEHILKKRSGSYLENTGDFCSYTDFSCWDCFGKSSPVSSQGGFCLSLDCGELGEPVCLIGQLRYCHQDLSIEKDKKGIMVCR